MINTKNTKQIKISYHTVDAFGILNFDSKDQKFAYMSAENVKSRDAIKTAGNNIRFGKAVFTNESGKLVRTNVISDNAIKQCVFNSDCPYTSSEIWYKPKSVILAYITSQVMLLKGYMCADVVPFRHKSMLTFSCAKMCENTVPVMQVNSTKMPIPDSTSLFTTETCGDTEWRGTVLVNVGNGENFINFSQSVPTSVSETEYENIIRDAFGNKELAIKDYTRKAAVDCPSERGIILSGKEIAGMVNLLLDRIRNMSREGRGASLGQVIIDGIEIRGEMNDIEPNANGWCKVAPDSEFGCVEPREVYRESTKDEVNAVNIAVEAHKAADKKKADKKNGKKTKPNPDEQKPDENKKETV
jgi:hypothetical protein